MHKDTRTYDIIIIGGGCAGAATALSLIQQGIKNVAIIEKNDFLNPRVGETIQPPTSKLLKELGIWEQFLNEGHLPSYGVASAWGTNELTYADFIFRAQGKGWHLDRNQFDKMMLDHAEEKGVIVFSATRFKKSSWQDNKWILECDTVKLNAKFVVDATGRANTFAKQQGSNKILFDDLHGIYTYWNQPKNALKKFGTTHTLVESGENGWWYSALLPNNVLAVAFMTDTNEIKTQGLKQTDTYLKQLKNAPHTSKRVNNHKLQSLPAIKVATSYELDNITGDHWLAVGDCASTQDPLSSYGIHKALLNGIEAGKSISAVFKGDNTLINEYGLTINKGFENYLAIRYKYYRMERRWSEHHFWKSRQQLISIHPKQEFTSKSYELQSHKSWNRILPDKDLNALITSCEQTKTAEWLVRDFQKKSSNKYPDWRVIQAVAFLHQKEVIG